MTQTALARTIPRLLVVDDDDVVPELLNCFKKDHGVMVEIVHARDVGEAVDKLNEQCFDAAIVDVVLAPGVTGVSLGMLVREHDANIPLAYLTNLDTESVRREAAAQRAFFLQKKRFFTGTSEGIGALLAIVKEMIQLNPCKQDGTRLDNQGFARELDHTPIKLPSVLVTLLNYSKSMARAA